jgi:hypothetical protein
MVFSRRCDSVRVCWWRIMRPQRRLPALRAVRVAGDHRHLLALILDSLCAGAGEYPHSRARDLGEAPGCTMVGLAGQVTLTVGGRPAAPAPPATARRRMRVANGDGHTAATVVRFEALGVKSTGARQRCASPDLRPEWNSNSLDIVLIDELIPPKERWSLKGYWSRWRTRTV